MDTYVLGHTVVASDIGHLYRLILKQKQVSSNVTNRHLWSIIAAYKTKKPVTEIG